MAMAIVDPKAKTTISIPITVIFSFHVAPTARALLTDLKRRLITWESKIEHAKYEPIIVDCNISFILSYLTWKGCVLAMIW